MARVRSMLDEKRIGLDLPDEVLGWLAKEGFDPQLGARPLKRLIQHSVVNRLARMVLEGRLKPGDLAQVKVEGEGLGVAVEAVQ
jgi:ATP-dependent Clp protease ATP-binding subunit ClpB